MSQQNRIRNLTTMALFTAIIFILTLTPIGMIQLPIIKATVLHIPVIIGSILLGPIYGGALGFMFGLASLIKNTLEPNISSFVFSPFVVMPTTGTSSALSLIVCFVPRILVGITPWLVYSKIRLIKSTSRSYDTFKLALAGVVGSLTNTILVMNLIYFLFKDSYAAVRNVAVESLYTVILGVIAANGIPEAIAAVILTVAVCLPLKSSFPNAKQS